MGVGVGVKAGVENGAMLTTYLFRYTSECIISWSNLKKKFLRVTQQGDIDPLTEILRTPLPLTVGSFVLLYFRSSTLSDLY